MNKIKDWELEEMFDEHLDEIFGDVKVTNMKWPTSKVLKRVDKVCYHQELGTFIDSLLTDGHIHEIDGDYYKGA